MANETSPFAECTRFLNGHGPRDPALALQTALDELKPGETADIYGTGALINDFEAEVAALLGKEAALFMPSGTMAQQIALRIWCEHASCLRVAFHATSHLQLHEEGAVGTLHGVDAQLLGDATRLFNLGDLQTLSLPLAAILWELPQREIGGQVPTFSELEEQVQWARAKGIRAHLDGARLWEVTPNFERSHAQVCAPFDSVYVSFYKGLGGIAGAVLAGDTDFIEAARPWLRRHGGNLISMYPFVLSARVGLRKHLDRLALGFAKSNCPWARPASRSAMPKPLRFFLSCSRM